MRTHIARSTLFAALAAYTVVGCGDGASRDVGGSANTSAVSVGVTTDGSDAQTTDGGPSSTTGPSSSTSSDANTTESSGDTTGSPTEPYEDLFVDGPIGFGRNATGGTGGTLCFVTSLADDGPGTLRACATRDEPTWVRFEARGEIVLLSPIAVSPDLTIDGRDGDPIVITGNQRLFDVNVENVIINDLTFVGNGDPDASCGDCGDPVMIRVDARDIWVDHCWFTLCGDECLNVWNGANEVTISWSRFEDAYYGMVLGWSQTIPDAKAEAARVTVHHNYFNRIKRRSPRVVTAQTHLLNNFIRKWGNDDNGYGSIALRDGELRIEANVYEAPSSNKYAARAEPPSPGSTQPPGLVAQSDNRLLSGATIQTRMGSSVFDPSATYPYTADPANAALEDTIKQKARPR